jgi:hypothetical protein
MDLTHLTPPAVLALFGSIFLALAIVSRIETRFGSFGPLSSRMRGMAGVFGVVLIVVAVYAFMHQPPPQMGQNAQATETAQTGSIQKTPAAPAMDSAPPSVDPERLMLFIKENQQERVRDSTGTTGYQCFTEGDLAKFHQDNVPDQVVGKLLKDAGFVDLVLTVKAMEPAARQNLLKRGLTAYRPPWSQLQLDPATASQNELLRGQSDAGSKAEKEIAVKIVNLVRDLSKRSESDLKKLYP